MDPKVEAALDPNTKEGRAYYALMRKKRKTNNPPKGDAWLWLTKDLMESSAWRAMSPNAHRALDRIMIEHMAHAGTENGNLPVTHEDFVTHGVTRRLVKDAIQELENLGLIKRTVRGGRWHGSNKPSRFRLTWIGDRRGQHPTNEWKGRTEAVKDRPRKNGGSRNGGTEPPEMVVPGESGADHAAENGQSGSRFVPPDRGDLSISTGDHHKTTAVTRKSSSSSNSAGRAQKLAAC